MVNIFLNLVYIQTGLYQSSIKPFLKRVVLTTKGQTVQIFCDLISVMEAKIIVIHPLIKLLLLKLLDSVNHLNPYSKYQISQSIQLINQ